MMLGSRTIDENLAHTDSILDAAERSARGGDAEARAMVRACLLDWTACAMLGAREPLVETLLADAQEFGSAGNLPLVGRPQRLGLREAALVNGVAGHAVDYDDGLEAMIAHPSVSVAPALLGLATHLGRSGEDLVTAYILALDFGSRVGLALSYSHYDRGFHGTASVGALAVAAGSAWLLGLTGVQRATAIGLAATRTGGLKASFGTDAKPLHAGWAAMVGLTAAQWAQRGLTSATDILAHPVGLRAFTDDYDLGPALAEAPPYILQVGFKRYASCGMTHAVIEAILKLRREQSLPINRIARVTLHVCETADMTCNQHVVHTGSQAKFSVRMVAAMALSGIDLAAPDNFSEEIVARPEIRALFDRTDVDLRHDLARRHSIVSIELTDGMRLEVGADTSGYDPQGEMQAVRPKFDALVQPLLGMERAAALKHAIETVDGPGPIAPLLEMTRIDFST